MKRLLSILRGMDPHTETYDKIYTGPMVYIAGGLETMDYDNCYYNGNVGFEFGTTHKLAQSRPTVTVIVPFDSILRGDDGFPVSSALSAYFDEKGKALYEQRRIDLKRLYYILRNQNDKNNLYAPLKRVIPTEPNIEPWNEYDNDFYFGDKMMSVEMTHKLAKDRPTVTLSIPTDELGFEHCGIAAADHCLRAFLPYVDKLNGEILRRGRPAADTGMYILPSPGGEILVRNTAYFALCPQRDYQYCGGISVRRYDDDEPRPPKMCLCIRMQVQLPQGRHDQKKIIRMLVHDLPDAVERYVDEFDPVKLEHAVALSEKQRAIREWIMSSEYCAFLANGSILPRSKGTELPMEGAVPFTSPPGDEIEICGVRGMGIRRGVTVITGGGYSGKSTMLDAISAGVYDHVAGDGRELCITEPGAVTISAEDGRSVKEVNISPFIKWLPGGDAAHFSTERASGSTSQAANIMEAVDYGSRLLLIDEDRSATNFMIRDSVMKALIENEPITPFTDRVNELCRDRGVSTILVIGGSGEYLSVADRVYMMRDFVIEDVTDRAKALCAGTTIPRPEKAEWEQHRALCGERFTSYPENSGSESMQAFDAGIIFIGDEKIDVRGLHDIVTPRQIYALGFMLRTLEISNTDTVLDIRRRVDELYERIDAEGLDCVHSAFFTTGERFLDLPRREELLAVINRMRLIEFKASTNALSVPSDS